MKDGVGVDMLAGLCMGRCMGCAWHGALHGVCLIGEVKLGHARPSKPINPNTILTPPNLGTLRVLDYMILLLALSTSSPLIVPFKKQVA